MNKVIDTLRTNTSEIKEYRSLMKTTDSKVEKSKYASLIYFNLLYYVALIIPILCSVYFVIGAFIFGYYMLFLLLFSIPFTLFILFIKRRVYPKMKENMFK